MQINIKSKIFSDFNSFQKILETWKKRKEKIVFTNGCFDIIHHGHVDSLVQSAQMGTRLIVGLNSDQSVKTLKGKNRPVINEEGRAMVLAAFGFVDAVVIFPEETPADLISKIVPNVLVKGNEYEIHEIAGSDTVLNNGGEVKALELVPGISTSELIQKIKTL